jgi:selT/selW/selH-like putative selenoprotein
VAEVSITYCVPCRYEFKAIQDANAILLEFGTALTALRIVPGDRGVYDVAVDGELVFSLDEEARFPETKEILEKIRARVRSKA